VSPANCALLIGSQNSVPSDDTKRAIAGTVRFAAKRMPQATLAGQLLSSLPWAKAKKTGGDEKDVNSKFESEV
jgi:hypothetical protein